VLLRKYSHSAGLNRGLGLSQYPELSICLISAFLDENQLTQLILSRGQSPATEKAQRDCGRPVVRARIQVPVYKGLCFGLGYTGYL
jgi:hypothetical protein